MNLLEHMLLADLIYFPLRSKNENWRELDTTGGWDVFHNEYKIQVIQRLLLILGEGGGGGG